VAAQQATEDSARKKREIADAERHLGEDPSGRDAARFAAGWLEANIRNRLDVIPIKTRKYLEVAIAFLKKVE